MNGETNFLKKNNPSYRERFCRSTNRLHSSSTKTFKQIHRPYSDAAGMSQIGPAPHDGDSDDSRIFGRLVAPLLEPEIRDVAFVFGDDHFGGVTAANLGSDGHRQLSVEALLFLVDRVIDDCHSAKFVRFACQRGKVQYISKRLNRTRGSFPKVLKLSSTSDFRQLWSRAICRIRQNHFQLSKQIESQQELNSRPSQLQKEFIWHAGSPLEQYGKDESK